LNKIDNHQSQFFPTTKLPEHPKTPTSITTNQGATITMSSHTGNPIPVSTTSPINKKRRGSNSLPDIIDQDIHAFSKDIEQLESNTTSEPENITIPTAVYRNLLARIEKLEKLTNYSLNLPKINQKNNKTQKHKNSNTTTTTNPANFTMDLTKQTPFDQIKTQTPVVGTANSMWATVARKNTSKQPTANKQKNNDKLEKATNKQQKQTVKKPTKQYFSADKIGLKRAHRAFSEPATTPSSYEFVHIPCNRRITKQDARALLKQIGIQQSRVIDIQFPARNTVSFFVHSEFAPEFRGLLTKHQFKEKENFNFFDETIIANPAFTNLGQTEKKALAKEIYNKRMVRLCTERLVAKPFLGRSIARFLANTTNDLQIPASEFGELFKSKINKQRSSSAPKDTTTTTPIDPTAMETQ
jgi:hypothetical protein